MPKNRASWKVIVSFWAALLLYFGVLGRTRLLNDADTLWHTVVGREILTSGFSTSDSFSFTRYGERWIANQWLAECLLAVFDYLGGLDGLLWLTVFVLTCTYLAVGIRLLRRGIDTLLSAAFLTLVVSASAYTLHARPHIFSIACLGAAFVLLRRAEDHRIRIIRLWTLVPIMILWSNLHGAVLGGVGTIGLVAVAWTLQPVVGMDSPIRRGRDVVQLWTIVLGCAVALIATPFGSGSLETWLIILRLPLQDLVTEHVPLDPGSVEGLLAIFLVMVYATIFASAPRAWSQPTFWLPIVWFCLTCTRIRHAPLFAIVAGLAIADLLPRSALEPLLRRRGWLGADGGPLSRPSTQRLAVAFSAVFASLLGATVWMKHVGSLPLVGEGWARPAARIWPEEILPALNRLEQRSPAGTAIFNEPILGGFLIYNFPDFRVFIDGRCELYGEQFLREFVAAWRDPSVMGKWQEQYEFRAALVEAESPLRAWIAADNRWRLVAETPTAALYERP